MKKVYDCAYCRNMKVGSVITFIFYFFTDSKNVDIHPYYLLFDHFLFFFFHLFLLVGG